MMFASMRTNRQICPDNGDDADWWLRCKWRDWMLNMLCYWAEKKHCVDCNNCIVCKIILKHVWIQSLFMTVFGLSVPPSGQTNFTLCGISRMDSLKQLLWVCSVPALPLDECNPCVVCWVEMLAGGQCHCPQILPKCPSARCWLPISCNGPLTPDLLDRKSHERWRLWSISGRWPESTEDTLSQQLSCLESGHWERLPTLLALDTQTHRPGHFNWSYSPPSDITL